MKRGGRGEEMRQGKRGSGRREKRGPRGPGAEGEEKRRPGGEVTYPDISVVIIRDKTIDLPVYLQQANKQTNKQTNNYTLAGHA